MTNRKQLIIGVVLGLLLVFSGVLATGIGIWVRTLIEEQQNQEAAAEARVKKHEENRRLLESPETVELRVDTEHWRISAKEHKGQILEIELIALGEESSHFSGTMIATPKTGSLVGSFSHTGIMNRKISHGYGLEMKGGELVSYDDHWFDFLVGGEIKAQPQLFAALIDSLENEVLPVLDECPEEQKFLAMFIKTYRSRW